MGKHRPGNLERRGDAFRVRLCVGGVRHYVTVPTTDRKVAARVAAQRLRELEAALDRGAMGLPGETRMSALLEIFETQKLPALTPGTQRCYRDSLKVIRSFFIDGLRNPFVATVRAKDVMAFLTWRRVNRLGGGVVSNRTLQKDRTILHRIFVIAEQLELRDGNPVSRVEPPKADTRSAVILTDEQYERLLTACVDHPMLGFYVLVLTETGMRSMSEALHVRWEDVDLESGFVTIVTGRDGHRTKSGKGRSVPMTPRLHAAMREHFASFRLAAYNGERSPWLFHHVSTRRHYQAGARIGSLRNAFNNAVKRAKLGVDVHQHDLRHRRVTTWLAQGKNPVLVKEAMGHSDLRVTMQYTHLVKEHLRSLVDVQEPVARRHTPRS